MYTGGARESTGAAATWSAGGRCSKSTNSFPMLKLIVGAVLGAVLGEVLVILASSRHLRRRGVSCVLSEL